MLRLLSSGRTVSGLVGLRSGVAAHLGRRSRAPASLLTRQQQQLISSVPGPQGLYNPKLERDSCGVGLVAQLKRKASRQIVVDANEMLVRMSHRGGCGCEPNTGDGAGMLVAIPDHFMRKVAQKEFGVKLPAVGGYAVGNLFVAKNDAAVVEAKDVMKRILKQRGFDLLGVRHVPTNNDGLGASALATEPYTLQMFVANKGYSEKDFEREMFRVRKLIEAEAELSPHLKDLYICSLSTQTITYKGQLTPEQLYGYYLDLDDPDFVSHMALVHSRFSTNTFPSWDRAQPVRMMCHNGEINTLRGNKNMAQARSGLMESPYFKDSTNELLPIVSDKMSDSGNFDSCLETLVKGSNRSLPETVMMMVPEAWQDNQDLSDTKKAFYEYNSCIMEPWDGPAMIAFTDGRYIGATLDRNGLRPSRYYVTHDDRVLLSSEVGVLSQLPDSIVRTKARLEPGKMFLVDFEKGEIVPDSVIKEEMAERHPYGQWVQQGLMRLEEWEAAAKKAKIRLPTYNLAESNRRFNLFGYTTETMDMLLYPMGVGGKEALGSMGNDAPLAVLSTQPRNVFDYFKQLFAQVTNPPIDPIREEMVMSLVCPVGPEANLLEVGPEHAARLVVNHPILTIEQLQAVKDTGYRGWKARTIDTTFPVGTGAQGLQDALNEICEQAAEAIQGGYHQDGLQLIVLSDRMAGPDRLPIPSLLAVGAVHQHLLQTKQRPRVGLFLECGDAREVHDVATLLGYGADGICPYVAYEALIKLNQEGHVRARSHQAFTDEELMYGYRKALAKGLLKVMSKMGISTLQSYKGAQVFEAVGLADEVVDRCFTGTTSRIQGAGFDAIYTDIARLHEAAYPYHTAAVPLLRNPGQYHYRDGGEKHLNTPMSMVALQQAARTNSREAYKLYTKIVDETNAGCNLRGLLRIRGDASRKIPIDEVEPAAEIVKRFNTGAMSLGSISRETHETLAVAMNTLGGRSNTGEGGEDPVRFNDKRRSAIKQVASGRFGVTSHYLANSDQIQIKMAQGAKPGEGGELPGFKVSPYIAQNRHTTPGVGLISPPPHHDIYSIEDLAQLIHDLKNANPPGDVSVKLVSEVGVGVVAAGVAKAKADHITVSGGDGGTGAAAWTGIKGAGLPWELGIAETQQTLVLNDLRSRVRLQTDGQIKTGKDVVVATLLGAEEFGFSTAPLIALGCIMMRKCHLNTCPVGVATQDPLLRKKFSGQPEHVVNFFFMMAEEIREFMAELGYRRFEDMVGQVQHLEVNPEHLHYKSQGLDLKPLLIPAKTLNDKAGIIKTMDQDHLLDLALDNKFLELAKPALEHQKPVQFELPVTNLNRTVGTILSYHISKKYGKEGLPDDTIKIKLRGHGGQSLGFTLAQGVTIEVEGDSNDYVGKGLSGGKIAVYPATEGVLDKGFVAEDNVVVGNVCLYGATRGKAFFRGKAGERFCVRNSGAIAVVEGVGDHGCEYMTGGRVVVLGDTGRNFAAGMSGGIAYIFDPNNEFPDRCNKGMVELQTVDCVEEAEQLRYFIEEHVDMTGSVVGKRLLADFDANLKNFVKVMPTDYARVLAESPRGDTSDDEAQVAISF